MSIANCAVLECDSKATCKNLCEKHRSRLRRNGTTERIRKPPLTVCSVPGCSNDKKGIVHGLCQTHRYRLKNYGTYDRKPKKWETMVGMKVNNLTMVGIRYENAKVKARCLCDCGNTSYPDMYAFRTGKIKSCGCTKGENIRRSKIMHGHTNSNNYTSPEFRSWYSMLQRCSNQNNKSYRHYGGRGIKVCDDWSDFRLFMRDMGCKPTKKHTLDRINNDGNYELGNCRWATAKEQVNNRRLSVKVLYKGSVYSLKDLSDLVGVPYTTMNKRRKNSQLLFPGYVE